MAKHASALKQQRQNIKRRARNRSNVSQLKSQVKKLRTTIAKGGEGAEEALRQTVAVIDRAAKKGVIHDNAAARAKSRLTRRVNSLSNK